LRPPTVFALSVHAAYACRHSGACCTAGWSIPVESHRQAVLGTALLTPEANGACAFFDVDRSMHRCRVQRAHGEAMLPDACRHFPRRALLDDRGTFVTLSHFCPTAASLLFDETPLSIVAQPAAFPETRTYEGLDARGQWPPLVRHDLLFDLGTYSRWEAFVVDRFARESAPSASLLKIATAAARLRTWSPADGDFADLAATVLADTTRDAGSPEALEVYRAFAAVDGYARVIDSVPVGLSAPAPVENATSAFNRWAAATWANQPAVRRYLAAKAFGSWAAYEGRGVRTLVAELVTSEMVLRVEAARVCAAAERALDRTTLHEAIRAADWLLIHLAERQKLIAWWNEAEP
jgi:hypothetical protein